MNWETLLDKALAEALPELRVLPEEPMSRHTSFHIGGRAKRMAFPDSAGQLETLLPLALKCGARPLIIGNGTNLLVPDEGLDRLVISTSGGKNHSGGLCRLETGGVENAALFAEAGCSLRKAAEFACEHALTGMEFAHGIPGSIGGAVCMNAGAYGGSMDQILAGASVWFPETGTRFIPADELRLGYRHSLLTEQPEAVLLSASLRLREGDPAAIREQMRDLMARRKKTQPLEFPSAGSVFKRPAGHFAGALIEQCGLKGFSIGGAQVSEKHAGFIVNRGGAACADVTALIAEIQRRVFLETGVALEPEVRVVS